MKDSCSSISRILERYFDRQATVEERAQVERHLPDCPVCHERLMLLEGLREAIRTPVEEALKEETFPWVWEKVERGIHLKGKTSWWESFRFWLEFSPFKQKKIWVPLVATTMLFLLAIPFLFEKTPSFPAPSVVEYVESQTSNVMVYELEKAKVTVIWLFEDGEMKSST